MIIAYLFQSIVAVRIILFSAVDYTGIASLVAAAAAFVTFFFSYVHNKRTATVAASVSYVDNNLKTLQASLDWLTKDNESLRGLNEQQREEIVEQRKEIDDLRTELHEVEERLDSCKSMCDALNRQLNKRGGLSGTE